ncbi:MAG: nitrogen fixation protein NifZ [Nitrospinae bacterium]|nr:nitrogen fixation protein NifZ [Nitrospinota bacterium]
MSVAKFQVGDCARLLYDIVSDGTVYGMRRGELIQRAGAVGYVKRQGWFLDSLVYDIHFMDGDKIIGCREHELQEGLKPWAPPLFAKGELVKSPLGLTKNGVEMAPAGATGTIRAVRHMEPHGYVYEVLFDKAAPGLLVVSGSQLENTGTRV